MSFRELVGYALIVIAIGLAVGGLWAAVYYSPARRYQRIRAQERRAARRQKVSRQAGGQVPSFELDGATLRANLDQAMELNTTGPQPAVGPGRPGDKGKTGAQAEYQAAAQGR